MPVTGLDHYALLSSDEERTTRFYTEVVGLEVGYRPDLSFPGIWFYVGKEPVVHVIFGKEIDSHSTGAVDHLAFKASGNIEATLHRLRTYKIEFTKRTLERTGVVQIFFRDPDNVGIELNFAPERIVA